MALDACLDTRDSIVGERGKDFEEVVEQQSEEKKLAEKYGIDLEGSTMTPLLADKTPIDDDVTGENQPNAEEGDDKPLTPKRFAQMRKLALAGRTQ